MKRLIAVLMVLCLIGGVALAEESLSVTTGLPTENEYAPYIVMEDNVYGARPQIGVALADVIYELEIQNGGYTRYALLFNDSIPTLCESIRSARIMHADIASDWNAALLHFGGQKDAGTSVYDYLSKHRITHYDGMSIGGGYFYRDDKREAPHNVAFKMANFVADKPNTPEVKSPLHFDAEAYSVGEKTVKTFEITYRKDSCPAYSYREDEGVYYRFYNREPYKDGKTGEQITCSNIIVMYADYTYYKGDNARPLVTLYGTNRCEFFIDGTCIEGYWERANINDSTHYYDAQGNEIVFKPGRTCIQIVRTDKADIVIY